MADALTIAGRAAEALTVCDEAIGAIKRGPQMQFLAQALVAKADALARLGRPTEAETCYREALATAGRQGGNGDALWVATRYGDLLLRAGRAAEIRDDLESLLAVVDTSVNIPPVRAAQNLLAQIP